MLYSFQCHLAKLWLMTLKEDGGGRGGGGREGEEDQCSIPRMYPEFGFPVLV